MPEIIIYLAEGRSKEAKKALMRDITDAVVKNLGVSADAVVVQIVEFFQGQQIEGRRPIQRALISAWSDASRARLSICTAEIEGSG